MSNASLNTNDSHNILGNNNQKKKKKNLMCPGALLTQIADTLQTCHTMFPGKGVMRLLFFPRLKIDCSAVTNGVHCCYWQTHTQADHQ